MPITPNEYQQKIMQGRQLIMRRSLDELETEIIARWVAEMRDVLRQLQGNQISPEAADRLRRQIVSAIQRWSGGVDIATKRGAERVISGARQLHEELLKKSGISVNYSFEGFSVDALEGMFVRRGIDVVNSFKTLQNSKVSDAIAGPLADALEHGIRGGNWQQTTDRIARLLALGDMPDIDRLRRLASHQGMTLTEFVAARLDDIEDEVGFRDALKRQMFNARRIAQTEIDVAAHEGERVAAVRNPIVGGLKWKTSTRHRTLSSAPDVCDILEQYDFHGLGPGVYYPNTLPPKPHPFDGCTRLYVFRKQSEWQSEKPKPRQPATITEAEVAQIMNANLTSTSRELTPRFINYTTAQANRYVQLAWQAWQQQQTQVA